MSHPVHLTFPRGAVLFGELTDWLHGRVLPEGTFSASLPPGLYAYKARFGDAWLEPGGRTRSVGGVRNEVLVVGGAEEPLLFAPGAPCVSEDLDGTLRVFVGLRRGHGEHVRLRYREDEGDPFVAVDCAPFVEEDEHSVLLAVLPVSSDAVELAFEIDGQALGDVLRWQRGPRVRVELGNVYTVLVDRFRRVPEAAWVDPRGDAPAGGNLDGVTASLDELRALGVETLYLTPVQRAASCHRYDLVDPLQIDPALGGEAAFGRLVEGVHARGMRLLLDFSFVHVGAGFPAYEDVRKQGRASRFAAWFQWQGEQLRHYGHRDDAPLLDLASAEVRALALETVEYLARLGVDGFRFDAVADVPLDFAEAVRRRLREVRPEAIVLGEVVPPHAFRFASAVDFATDFSFHALSTAFVAQRSIDAAAFAEGLRRAELVRGSVGSRAVRFLSTHDHPRFASIARRHGDSGRTPLGLLLLLASPGIPALLYGEELGLSAADVAMEIEGAWADRMPMPWRDRDEELRTRVAHLLALRARSRALARGSFEVLFAEGPLLVFRRRADETLDVALNASDTPLEVDLEDDELGALEVLAAVGEARVVGQTLHLGANAGLLVRRTRSPEQGARRAAFFHALPVLRDRDLAAASPVVAGRPLRLDFSLTEVCNLRCAHCLTLAPEKTARGTARSMSPAVLDRLRDDLGHAAWFGFVHGGESLTSPLLFPMLQAIQEERPGGMVHLLTNGKLLRGAMTARLYEHGVRSLFVSLDGATAATNDRIRIGGDFQAICGNVRAAVELRGAQGLDLRIGLSHVVMRSNVGELGAFVELAAQLGVDWVKLEEPVPATPFARAEMLDLPDDRVAAAVERARSLGLVAVDHVTPPPVWRCRLDEPARAFLAADEFANRTEIHPCRAAWERACVFPNGDVAIDDFLLPVVGNVLATPLAELWNSPAAQRQREHAVARWICGGKPTCVG